MLCWRIRSQGGREDGEAHQVEDEFEQVSRGRNENPSPCASGKKPLRRHRQRGRGAPSHALAAPLVVSGVREGQRKRGSAQASARTPRSPDRFHGLQVIRWSIDEEGVAAHVCQLKRAADKSVVERVCDDINLFGHSGVVLKGDGEPALVQVQSAIKEKRGHPTI